MHIFGLHFIQIIFHTFNTYPTHFHFYYILYFKSENLTWILHYEFKSKKGADVLWLSILLKEMN